MLKAKKQDYDYQSNAVLQKITVSHLLFLSNFLDKQTSFSKSLPRKILDIGCGTGFIAQFLHGVDILQVDSNPQQIQYAQKFGKILQADFENINIDEKFDTIFSSMALHWAENLQNTISNLQKLLNDSGNIFFSIPLCGSLESLYSILNIPAFHFPTMEEITNMQNVRVLDVKIYHENAFLCLKNIHITNLKFTNSKITKKQLLLLKNTATFWKIGFFSITKCKDEQKKQG